MRIAVDFDGTLADTMSLVVQLMNFKHGTNYRPEDVDSWTFWETAVGSMDDFWTIYDIMDRTHLRRAIRPTSPFATPTIKRLLQNGHNVSLLTSNSHRASRDMAAWLFGHGLDIEVITLGRKTASQKADERFDLFIDDAPHLAEEIMKRPDKKMILVDQRWNRDVVCRGNVYRLDDWERALGLLRSIGVIV